MSSHSCSKIENIGSKAWDFGTGAGLGAANNLSSTVSVIVRLASFLRALWSQ